MLIHKVEQRDIMFGVWCAMSAPRITRHIFLRPRIQSDTLKENYFLLFKFHISHKRCGRITKIRVCRNEVVHKNL
jgi:hypothetical protein